MPLGFRTMQYFDTGETYLPSQGTAWEQEYEMRWDGREAVYLGSSQAEQEQQNKSPDTRTGGPGPI
jgi:hypothetical protein